LEKEITEHDAPQRAALNRLREAMPTDQYYREL
jgi:hypothetical protein